MSINKISKKHVVGIDALRFLAAFMVMWFHYVFLIGALPGSGVGLASRRVEGYPELFEFSHFGWVGVQIFFVISGFVIAFSGENASPFDFFSSRLVRLVPGAWICAPLSLLVVLLVGMSPTADAYRAFRHSMAFDPWGPWIDGSYWTLGIEIAFYTVVYVLIAFGRFTWIKALALFMGAVSSLFWLAVNVFGMSENGGFSDVLFAARTSRLLALLLVHHGLFFAIGILLWIHLFKKAALSNLIWGGIFCAGGCLQIIASTESINRATQNVFTAYVACAIWLVSVLLIVLAVRWNEWFHRIPRHFLHGIKLAGLMTFPPYLVHQIAGGGMLGAVSRMGFSKWSALAIVIFSMLVLACVIATAIEPVLQRAFRHALRWCKSHWLSGDAAAL